MYTKREIIVVIALISLVSLLGCVYSIDTGDAIAPEEEDVWTVHVSLVDGPISWEHTVRNKWCARSYVSSLEDDEPLGGYWCIYLNGKEFEATRWHGERD